MHSYGLGSHGLNSYGPSGYGLNSYGLTVGVGGVGSAIDGSRRVLGGVLRVSRAVHAASVVAGVERADRRTAAPADAVGSGVCAAVEDEEGVGVPQTAKCDEALLQPPEAMARFLRLA